MKIPCNRSPSLAEGGGQAPMTSVPDDGAAQALNSFAASFLFVRIPMSIRRFCVRLAAAFALCSIATFAAAQTKLLRFPDICNDRIVFTYGGDLWTVSSQGGTAIRLTAGPGLQESARFSPDCSQIAFTGQYSGEDQVYTMPANGGVPTQ